MSDETIVAIYDTPAHALLAAADLRQAGVPDDAIGVHTGSIDPGQADAPPPRERGFWSRLFGGAPDHDTSVYERSVNDGASVLTVKTPDKYVARVIEIVESHEPIDIDERALSYSASQSIGIENALDGKRVVNHGGTRIRRFVVE